MKTHRKQRNHFLLLSVGTQIQLVEKTLSRAERGQIRQIVNQILLINTNSCRYSRRADICDYAKKCSLLLDIYKSDDNTFTIISYKGIVIAKIESQWDFPWIKSRYGGGWASTLVYTIY